MTRVAALLALTLWGAVSAASAQTIVDRVGMADIAAFLREAGANARAAQEGGGRPVVIADVSGVAFQAAGFECDGKGADAPCGLVQFRIGVPDAPLDRAIEFANVFNTEHAYGRAFVDGRGLLICDYAIDLDAGVTRAHVRRLTLFWVEKVMPDFLDSAVDQLVRAPGNSALENH